MRRGLLHCAKRGGQMVHKVQFPGVGCGGPSRASLPVSALSFSFLNIRTEKIREGNGGVARVRRHPPPPPNTCTYCTICTRTRTRTTLTTLPKSLALVIRERTTRKAAPRIGWHW